MNPLVEFLLRLVRRLARLEEPRRIEIGEVLFRIGEILAEAFPLLQAGGPSESLAGLSSEVGRQGSRFSDLTTHALDTVELESFQLVVTTVRKLLAVPPHQTAATRERHCVISSNVAVSLQITGNMLRRVEEPRAETDIGEFLGPLSEYTGPF